MNKYEILGVVGEGAYGIVLKCKNKETGEFVAIKKFKESEEDERVRKSVQREVKMLRTLKHTNIIQLKEAFKKKGKILLVFPFVDKNLLELLEEKGCIEQELIRKFMFQIMLALNCCHQNGIVHRDIKPENLLVDNEGNLKLCDFGFARTLQTECDLTDYVATRWYRSPELLLSNIYGMPVDIWAAGCIMAEMIDGQPLFPGNNETDQLYVIQKVLGQLSNEQMEIFQKNPRYLGMKFPEIVKPETLERRYYGKMCQKGLSFLKACLNLNPDKRPLTPQLLEHPYLYDLWIKDQSNRPISHIKLRLSQEKDESKQHILSVDKAHDHAPRRILEKQLPQTIQNYSILQQNPAYNYKIEDTEESQNMHKTFNQSFRLKQSEPQQNRLGSENQDKRINKIKGESIQQGTIGITKKSKSPAKKIIMPMFYQMQAPKQLNLVYNANTYNYSIKKQVIRR